MRRLILTALTVAAVAASLLQPALADAHPAAPAGTHRNPLDLRLPGGGTAANCADPTVLQGHGGDRHWTLYCTTDALSESDRGADGELVQHLIPTYRSLDLVHWRYAGDAFAARPSWVADDAGLWAPEVVYRHGTYFLYYTASDTDLQGGGSAIGVATSDSATGPWRDAGGPVVAPADNPTSPGDARWTFDPEVLTVGRTAYLYFGSYFGGVFVRRLSADGLSTIASSERRITIANRYEGTVVVRHDGWYYFLGSATNCCNGALTGYGVFAARSRSPLGPFRDADGRSVLASRVGGTPVLAQNGNRWVGPGHNTVLTDAAGQQWIVYHAVDRTDPFVAGATDYTKRPALIDPLDWRDGWPVVRGGRGPSDSVQPAPAAQPGTRAAYHASAAPVLRPGAAIPALSDSFSGDRLAPRWTWIRKPDPSTVRVAGGRLSWDTQDADLHPPAVPLAGVLAEPSPGGAWVAQARVRTTVPATGDEFNYRQGGIVVYRDADHYVKLASTAIFETRQTEFGLQDADQPEGAAQYGNQVVGPVGSWTWLRIVRHRVGGAVAYTAATSVDGRHWRTGGTWTTDLGAHPRIGIVSLGGAGSTTLVDSMTVSRLRR